MATLSFKMCCQYWKKASLLIKLNPHLVVEYMFVKRSMCTVSIFFIHQNVMKELYFIGNVLKDLYFIGTHI